MSKNFVLVQYGNQTRKIQGDPTRKKYNTLVRQIQDKFDFDHEVTIQVFDRDNNQYFAIDSSEIREISNGGKIKVTRAKGGGGGKSAKKGKGSPMKPPGVPPPTKEDDAKRSAWKKGSVVEIYSESERKWIRGEINKVYNDNEGEWLVIRYAANRSSHTKEIQRFSNYIRPSQSKRKQKQKQDVRDRESPKKKDTPKRERKEREPKAPKVVKVTTQSKYRRVKRAPTKEEAPENVVDFKGNGHIKQYIDRACMLLRGPKEAPEEEVKADDDEKAADHDGPSKKYDVVHLLGVGRAMAHVVSAAEIIKRIVPGLHQETKMEVQEIVDVYEPTEAGLKNVEVSRSITGIRVTLSVDQKGVDSGSAGYQEPEQHEDGFGAIEYKYPDEVKPKGRGKGKGRKGRRDGGGNGNK